MHGTRAPLPAHAQRLRDLVLGEAAARNPQPGDRIRAHVEGRVAERGLPGAAAAVRMTRSAAAAGERQHRADPEAG